MTTMAPSIAETEPVAQVPVTKKVDDVKSQPVIDKHEEHQYLDLIREILETGEHRPDRYS
jgi:thymidylate synthase